MKKFLLFVLAIFCTSGLAADLKGTRAFTETFPCDGAVRTKYWYLKDSVSHHVPIQASGIRIYKVWASNYGTHNDSAVYVFRKSLDGVVATATNDSADIIMQLNRGQLKETWDFPAGGIRLMQVDFLHIDYVCFSGGSQQIAVWVFYEEIP
jgi:hypothetical protein